MLHSKDSGLICPLLFGQDNPRWFCPFEDDPQFRSKGYRVKHRCPRCSRSCFQSWSDKRCATMTRFLCKHLDSRFNVFFVVLDMPTGATESDHAQARERFLHGLRMLKHRARKKGKPFTLELSAQTHITAPTDQHYDAVAYSDLSERRTRHLIGKLWENAGGKVNPSCTIVDPLNVPRVVAYVTKNKARHRTRHYLPHPDCTLRYVWGTGGFFRPVSRAFVWAELRQKWFTNRVQASPAKQYNE